MLRSPTANTEMAAMDSSYSVAKTKPVKVEEKKKKIKKLVDFENVCHENPNMGFAFVLGYGQRVDGATIECLSMPLLGSGQKRR